MTQIKNQAERQRIGLRIAEIRRKKNISQIELADKSGIRQTHISRIERGCYGVTIDVLSAIAKALDTTIDFVE